MNWQNFMPLISAIIGVGGVLATLLIYRHGRIERMRQQYRFSRELGKDFRENPDMHPRERAAGLTALVGRNDVTPEILEYLYQLKLVSAFDDYRIAKKILIFDRTTAGGMLLFSYKFEFAIVRFFYRISLYVLIGSFFAWGMAGRIYEIEVMKIPFDDARRAPVYYLYLGLTALSAVWSSSALGRLNAAERLVGNQQRYEDSRHVVSKEVRVEELPPARSEKVASEEMSV